MTLWTVLALAPAYGADSLPDQLAARATRPDVVLVPPVGEPSPQAGSFLIAYVAAEGQEADPAKVGTFDVGPSSCSDALRFKKVDATETRSELWLLDSGAGARIGLPQFGVSVGASHRSIAGVEYAVQQKLIVDGGLEALEMCCLRSPEKCTDRYVSEYWIGTGKVHRMTETKSGLKSSLKALDKLGKIDFGATSGWNMSSTWDEPMYFAYRTSAFQTPSCKSFMNDLPEVDDQVLFTGVSERVPSEQAARRDAQTDARQQIVRYLGEELKIEGDEISTRAEALLSGVKDSLTCLDEVEDTPEGPSYLARVRMYISKEAIDGKAQPIESRTGGK